MLKNQKNSKKQGDVGVGSAIAYFTSKGLTVCIPLTDSQEYDLVVDIDGPKRVQVKTTTRKLPTGNYEVDLRTRGGNRSWNGIAKKLDRNRVEFLFALSETGDRYLIPTSALSSNASVTLGKNVKNFLLPKSDWHGTGS